MHLRILRLAEHDASTEDGAMSFAPQLPHFLEEPPDDYYPTPPPPPKLRHELLKLVATTAISASVTKLVEWGIETWKERRKAKVEV